MNNLYKNVLIGSFVFLALLSLGVALVLFKPSYGDGNQIVHVRFSNVNKIYPGTTVTLAGKLIGKVLSIEDIEREEHLGALYFYQVTLEIDSKVVLYESYEFGIDTSGLLGEQSIAIIPQAPMEKRIHSNSVVYAQPKGSLFSQTFDQISQVARELERTLRQFSALIYTNQQTITNVIQSMQSTFYGIDDLVHRIQKQEIVEFLGETIRTISSETKRFQEENLLEEFGLLQREITSFFSSGNQLLHQVNSGEGNVGKLLYRENLYLQMLSVLYKTDQILEAIGEFGLLFHSSRGWKKTQADRQKAMKDIQNFPKFSRYLDEEMRSVVTLMQNMFTALQGFQREHRESGEFSLEKEHKLELLLREFSMKWREVEEITESWKEEVLS